jgi:hypothetical protein
MKCWSTYWHSCRVAQAGTLNGEVSLVPCCAQGILRYPWLEELRLKRMVVTDESLELLAHSFPNFKVLVLTSCDGFSTDGLATIAAHCRHWPRLAFVPYLFVSFQSFRTIEACEVWSLLVIHVAVVRGLNPSFAPDLQEWRFL